MKAIIHAKYEQLRAALRAVTEQEAVGCAEREVGRSVYIRIGTLSAKTSKRAKAELAYLLRAVEEIEEYGSTDWTGGPPWPDMHDEYDESIRAPWRERALTAESELASATATIARQQEALEKIKKLSVPGVPGIIDWGEIQSIARQALETEDRG